MHLREGSDDELSSIFEYTSSIEKTLIEIKKFDESRYV